MIKASVLNPSWSRIVHRLHSLGVVEARYTNAIAQITEVGKYPRHITSSLEDKSESIDGSTLWNFLNWQHGWVTQPKSPLGLGTEFAFLSSKHALFHSIRLLENQQDDCLRCLLQLFARAEPNHTKEKASPQATPPIPVQSLAHICELTLNRANQKSGFSIDLFTEGGIVSKRLKAADLTLNPDRVTLHCYHNTQIDLHPHSISYHQSIKRGSELHTTFYNPNHLPQACLKLVA
ncbi:hypothetical protein [Rubritalea tangerina]|uniref:WYL domain-containing protein n=1 Tax=Rubritalea tangerina TaxID=430798 RepID=A0ABW4ZA97_9BACT